MLKPRFLLVEVAATVPELAEAGNHQCSAFWSSEAEFSGNDVGITLPRGRIRVASNI
jgi:hypothetical protein